MEYDGGMSSSRLVLRRSLALAGFAAFALTFGPLGAAAQTVDDIIAKNLAADGIGTGIHYPTPLHLGPLDPPSSLGAGAFPIAERAATEILSLPMFPDLSPVQQARVVERLARAVAGSPAGSTERDGR